MAKEVDDWFKSYDNPMKPVVQEIRNIILSCDKKIEECIKWQAPTFVYKGNIASFFPKAKKHASLMFHNGAEIPGSHPLLEGDAKAGRSLKLASLEECKKAKKDIQKIIKAWIKWKDAEG